MAGKLLDETGLAELWSLIKARDNELNALANTKAKIAVTSYVGTGTCGESNPNSLTFDFAPKHIKIIGSYFTNQAGQTLFSSGTNAADNGYGMILCDRLTTSYQWVAPLVGNGLEAAKKSSDGKTISWYHSPESYQLNNAGCEYIVIAFG